MTGEELIASLENTALTTGAGANCFFQGFIHMICAQNEDCINGMKQFSGAITLVEVFNREVEGMHVADINQLITVAKAMHPLERELIFGPLMRKTLNELNLKNSWGQALTLEDNSIIFPPHAIAFAHALGFSFDEYTHKNDAEGMPDELKNDLVGHGNSTFYRVQHPLENQVGTLVLRLKSCHFEVGGLDPKDVQQHQSQIIPKEVLSADSSRPELPGARFYEEPSIVSHCAVKNAQVGFSTAVRNTVIALRDREGPHHDYISSATNLSAQNVGERSAAVVPGFSKARSEASPLTRSHETGPELSQVQTNKKKFSNN